MTTPNEWVNEPSQPPTPPPIPDQRHTPAYQRPVPLAVIALILILAVIVTVKVWQKLQPGDFTATGSITLISAEDIDQGSDGCFGTGGYSDLTPGAQVVIGDSAGKTLAVGELGTGTGSSVTCVLPFTVTGVPGGRKFYSVTVSHRGALRRCVT